ncbi:acyl-CoA dehydrogenase [Nonomuraea africana]|uniref:Alkylation response protein AidB-like acyl-CoA dehydrogenase n=1 Tax=Nonomuraea africana TaxID=46171 RepID=A0ABR9K662_9ACTN|nr:acyl-CoA dehydrogenase [Nonomuraea africana]MBE1557280.1 alkylation response protein AidB-like acyl-CoA dehydrogenase [Nonomuraea africana]
MNFAFTAEQLGFAAAVRDVLRDRCDPSDRLSCWKELAELGLFGALVPEESGGLGLSLTDLVPAIEETGRAAMPGPVVETLVAGPYAGVVGAPRVSLLVDGLALDADLADLIVDVAGPSIVSVRLEPRRAVDQGRQPFAATVVDELRVLEAPAADLVRKATVGVSAQLIGVARELLARSVAYAKARTQFGRPIGAFQAVKHQLADVAIAVEFAAPLVYRAALSADNAALSADRAAYSADGKDTGAPVGLSRPDRDVSAAKVAAGEAAALAARTALQVHGAIGYTAELDLRFWLARTWSLSAAYGTTAEHRTRFRQAVFGS